MKTVLIKSYEGDVLIKNLANNAKRGDVIEIARQQLQIYFKKSITDLSNLGYYVNNDVDKAIKEFYNNDKDFFYENVIVYEVE